MVSCAIRSGLCATIRHSVLRFGTIGVWSALKCSQQSVYARCLSDITGNLCLKRQEARNKERNVENKWARCKVLKNTLTEMPISLQLAEAPNSALQSQLNRLFLWLVTVDQCRCHHNGNIQIPQHFISFGPESWEETTQIEILWF